MSYSTSFNVEKSRPTKHAKMGKSENQGKKKKSPCLPSEETSSAQILIFQTVVLYKESSEEKKKVSVCVILDQIPVM